MTADEMTCDSNFDASEPGSGELQLSPAALSDHVSEHGLSKGTISSPVADGSRSRKSKVLGHEYGVDVRIVAAKGLAG